MNLSSRSLKIVSGQSRDSSGLGQLGNYRNGLSIMSAVGDVHLVYMLYKSRSIFSEREREFTFTKMCAFDIH